MTFRSKIRNEACELCPLHESAEHVCMMGSGPKKARIMIVGEAPGAREDQDGEPFVGPSGQLLTELLDAAGIQREDCYITNAAKCRPPDNRTPELVELKTCVATYLTQEFDRVDPEWVLLLGNSALRAVVGKSGITKYRGTPFDLGNATAYAAFHPAYALRNPRHLEPMKADFAQFGRMVRGESSPAGRSTVRIIKSKRGLHKLRDVLLGADVIAFDFETNDNGLKGKKQRYLKPWNEDGAPVCISFSVKEGESYVVPLYHAESPWENNWRAVLQFFKPALERDVKLVAHNGKFDVQWAAFAGLFVYETFDTMLAAHMVDENRLKGLKPLSQVMLGADTYGIDLEGAHDIPLRDLARYAGKDTDYTLRLYHALKQELIEQPRSLRVFLKLMMPASDALVRVEHTGLWLDRKRAVKVQAALVAKRDPCLEKLREYVPPYNRENINFNSHPQLAHWLFTELKLPIIERTAKGAPSSKESVLLQLAKQHPAPKLLLKYRNYKGNIEKVTSWIHEADKKDRVHTNYKLFGTVTGRLSSVEPNLQQVPREGTMRTCFGAPSGWSFIEADYSQVELRIAAMLSNDPTMLRAYLTGEDLHLKTAQRLTGRNTVTKEERKKGKAINFGFLYGMGEQKFIDYAKENYDVDVTEEEAHEARETFFRTYSELRRWHEKQRQAAIRFGRVYSPIGRTRHLPDIESPDKHVRADAERQAINSPVQSFASDLMLMALVRLQTVLRPNEARIVGTVHDAILGECRTELVDQTCEQFHTTMIDMDYVKRTFGYDVTVPIEVEIRISQHWGGEGYDYEPNGS